MTVKTYTDNQTLYTNITKEEVCPTYIIVRATSEKFGTDEVMYEATSHADANRYINRLEAKGKEHDLREAEDAIHATTKYLANRLGATLDGGVYGEGERGGYVQTFTTLDTEPFQALVDADETAIEGVSLEVVFDNDIEADGMPYAQGSLQINVTVSDWQYDNEMFEFGTISFGANRKPWQALNKAMKAAKLETANRFR